MSIFFNLNFFMTHPSTSSKDFPNILNDKEIIKVCSNHGKAEIKPLFLALKAKQINPRILLQDKDKDEYNPKPKPILFYTLGWGLYEHTKLLIEYGADLHAFSEIREVNKSPIKYQCLLQHFFLTDTGGPGELKYEKYQTLLGLGLDPLKLLPSYNFFVDLAQKNLDSNLNSTQNKIFQEYLTSKDVLRFDQPNQHGFYPVEQAILISNFKLALFLIKKNFTQKTNTSHETLLLIIAQNLTKKIYSEFDAFQSLTDQLIENLKSTKHDKQTLHLFIDELRTKSVIHGDEALSNYVSTLESKFLLENIKTPHTKSALKVKPRI